MKKLLIIVLLLGSLFSCIAPMKHKTQLEIRVMETRDYDAKNIKVVLKALMNVYQDEQYMLVEAVSDLGVINAVRTRRVGPLLYEPFAVFVKKHEEKKDKEGNKKEVELYRLIEIVSSSAHVTKFGKKFRVRVNFNIKNLDQFSNIYNLEKVEREEQFHKNFFNALDKSIYLENEGI